MSDQKKLESFKIGDTQHPAVASPKKGSSPGRKVVKRHFPVALRAGTNPAKTTDDLPLPDAPSTATRLRLLVA